MSAVTHYSECPLCGSSAVLPELTVKDYTVSQEIFDIWQCNHCLGRFTQDIPSSTEIGRYYQSDQYVSHTETKDGFIHKLYHLVRNYTIRGKVKMICSVTGLNKGVLLDVGAGTGSFASAMQRKGWLVTGLEPDATARENAKNINGLQLKETEALFQQNPGSYDAITLWHVLEHVHDLHEYLETFYQLLKPNGKLIIAVPNYRSHDASIYRQYWAAYDVPRHLYHFSPQSMQHLAHAHQFVIKSYKPMWFDSFYVSLLSEQYKTGKKKIAHAFVNGLRSNLKSFRHEQECSSVIYVMEKKPG